MDEKSERNAYPAEKARQGVIILRKSWQRWVFFSALAASVVLLVLFASIRFGW